jgi:uncharacterized protein (DUF362 family)
MISELQSIRSYSDTAAIRKFVEDSLSSYSAEVNLQSLKNRTIVIKPNWVQESHELNPDVWEPVITHPIIILTLIEVLAEKMEEAGDIIICDAPQGYADFDKIIERGNLRRGLDKFKKHRPELNIEILDLRREVWKVKDNVVVDRREGKLDPRGYIKFDLGKESLFFGHPGEGCFYGADYDSSVVNVHHSGAIQEYLIAGTTISCDLFINLPKMKTHKKTGITCCLKNLVGINGDKNWLPHHTEKSPSDHGDEFPDAGCLNKVEGILKRYGRKLALKHPVAGALIFRKARIAGQALLGDSGTTIRNGNWSGNNTCWRMALDLNRALLYGNLDGSLRNALFPKNYFAIVDGIVGGEGNGPLCPDSVNSGVLVAGDNPAEIDAIIARLMGFNPQEIPIIRESFCDHRWPISPKRLEDVQVWDQRVGDTIALNDVSPAIDGGFKPHFGWMNLRK